MRFLTRCRRELCQSDSSNRAASMALRFESLEERRVLSASPVGGEVLINEYTRGAQQTVLQSQSVAFLSEAEAVVTFTGKGPGDGWGVFARRGNVDGSGNNSQFLVNQTTVGAQQHSSVASLPGGGFAVTWEGTGDNYEYGIFARTFNNQGVPTSNEFQVNTTPNGAQLFPSISSSDTRFEGDRYNGDSDEGLFVITWVGKGQGDHWGVFARVYEEDGTPVTSEFLVNQTTRGAQHEPQVAMWEDGSFVVTWAGRGAGDNWGVFSRRFDRTGTPLSGETRVNQMTTGAQIEPAIAVGYFTDISTDTASDDGSDYSLDEGSQGGYYVVTWTGYGPNDAFGTFASLFNADGTRRADDILVNETTRGAQRWSSVASLNNGGFVTSWTGRGEGDYWGTFVREFGKDGVSETGERLVNTTQRGAQHYSSVAANGDRDYVVVWSGYGQGDHVGVFGRAYVNQIPTDGPIDGGTVVAAPSAAVAVDRRLPQDVNGDGAVSPTDVMAVISNLGQSPESVGNLQLDVDGNGQISPTDVLAVVQELDRLNSVRGVALLPNQQHVSSDATSVASPTALSPTTNVVGDFLEPVNLNPVTMVDDALGAPASSTATFDGVSTDDSERFEAVGLDDALVDVMARSVAEALG